MEQLEKRFYAREELAQIAGLDIHDHNFSGKMKRCLNVWGYEYQFIPRKGFEITRVPETPEEKLVELLRREIHIDTQIDPYPFACFIFALSNIEEFSAMPWETRERIFYENFKLPISQRTMMNWRNYLFKVGTAFPISKRTLWHSYYKNGRKIQEIADRESPLYKEYCVERSKLLDELPGDFVKRKEKWGTMVKTLFTQYGVYYYCFQIAFSAWGTAVQEINELSIEILTKAD